ncbi:glycosyltransferase family 87 protein [Paenirhodobacter enshiensis]|uniref:glycosyltransferase family 87 protein n=1 Tax=Paenirhodobacter enshiensis TaxID=1105367 RepID=UPI0035AE299E
MSDLPSRIRALLRDPVMSWALLIALAVLIADVAVRIPYPGANGAVIDFDAFYLVSQMIREGILPYAYDTAVMIDRESVVAGSPTFMPWSYPPQFDLLIAPLSFVPRWLSYVLFTGLTLTAYVAVLRRLAGPWLPGVLMAIFPALILVTRLGQSSLLIAALIGLSCLIWLRGNDGRGAAGLPLGLLIMKPHLGLGIGAAAVLERRGRILVLAATTVAITSALATLAFGPEIWAAFLAGSEAAQANMAKGLYPLLRMTSVYALLYSLGLPARIALAAQVAVAVAALASIHLAQRRRWPVRRVLGVATLATVAISPYTYDYDMPILGVALALLMQDLMDFGHRAERVALFAALWLCTGGGFFIGNALFSGLVYDAHSWVAFGGIGFLISAGLIGRILWRCPAGGRPTSAR